MDAQAWAETRRRLHAFVSARLTPEAAVDDVVQDVLTKMVEHLDDLSDGTRVEAWAYRIARNAVIDEYRRRGRQTVAVTRLGASSMEPEYGAADEAVLAAELVELSGCLGPLVEMLDAPYRDAILLTAWDGLTQAQAAERTGLSLPGMKSRVQRARTQLREQLLACCEPEAGQDGRGRPIARSCTSASDGCGCRGPTAPVA